MKLQLSSSRVVASSARRATAGSAVCRSALKVACVARPQRTEVASSSSSTSSSAWVAPVMTLAPMLLQVNDALAAGGEYGILEGRTAALVHPAIMFGLLGTTLYAGYLGYQWKRTRELGEEVRALKAAAAASATADAPTASPEIEAKEKERKELLAGNFKDKHWLAGSLLLAAGVGISIEGAANTFIRTGKLFPGPHLYAGATITFLWAAAAALVPAMQKGDNNARQAHIALNALNVALFLWQVPTGLEIVGKVFQFTSWP